MNVHFRTLPETLKRGCFMTAETVAGARRKLLEMYRKPGRPEIIRTVLIVDDDDALIRSYKRSLGGLGLNVIAVDTKRPIEPQVIQLISENQIDFINMDEQMNSRMPNSPGHVITSRLRKEGFQGYIAIDSSLPDDKIAMISTGTDFRSPAKQLTNPNLIASIFVKN